MTAWDNLIANSSTLSGTAWDHLNAQTGGGDQVIIHADGLDMEIDQVDFTVEVDAGTIEVELSEINFSIEIETGMEAET